MKTVAQLFTWINETFATHLPSLDQIRQWPVIKALYELTIDKIPDSKLPFRVKVNGSWNLMPGKNLSCTIEIVGESEKESTD